MTEVRVLTFNVDRYDPLKDTNDSYKTAGIDRKQLIPDIIMAANADVVLLQEVRSDDQTRAAYALRMIAKATKMECVVRGDAVTAKSEYDTIANGIMWGPRFQPHTWQSSHNYWHPPVHIKGEIEGSNVAFASMQGMSVWDAQQAGADLRVPEAMRTAALAQRHENMVIGMSGGSLSNVQDATGTYFDPAPTPVKRRATGAYAVAKAESDFISDRKSGLALERGGLVDIAAHLAITQGLARQGTSTRMDFEEELRTEQFYTCAELAAYAQSVEVIRTSATSAVSDYYPVVLTYQIPRTAA